ncbi:sensor histidine kinase [Streptomyces uncialis]|uniref:sensor histidine kinase n=1 Tax=Streptomyces uncialis TaxID=1048205 RepID=UPI0022541319|nr:sensor histidine kinase [Streptomyces uncialis]MCX4660996.1 sensor histidine kinase [Streptomyces uncialis]
MHSAFFLLLGASLARFLLRHPGEPRTPWVIALSVVLALLYVLGPVLGSAAPTRPRPPTTPDENGNGDEEGDGDLGAGGPDSGVGSRTPARLAVLLWLALVVAVWVVLVLLAPSFAWCAVPLFYTGLRILPARPALALIALLTAFVVAAQLQLAGRFDPNLLLAPPAVAAIATAGFVHMQRQAARQRALIDDLLRTRRELAATERRAGTLAERQRLAMEIHDTLAQGLSSQQMLLQAADRVWDAEPVKARTHVRTAGSIAERSLTEARRFVHDLAPADLADGGGLVAALRALAVRESRTGPPVRFHAEGTPAALPERAESALLRIAQGALANVREHADARTAALTLTCLDDQIVLDVADDGRGFVPGASNRTRAGVRGHGLPAIRARVRDLGGTLTIESAPGEGTVLTVSVPLAVRPPGLPSEDLSGRSPAAPGPGPPPPAGHPPLEQP